MSRRRSDKDSGTPGPFRYRPTPPPPVRGAPPRDRPRESPRRSRPPAGSFSNSAAVVWFLLLVLPALALRRLSEFADWRTLTGGVVFVSLVTWVLYRNDKSKAQTGAWRTPESTLHLAEFAGGWPAAFLAQRRYRHKIAKQSYQFTYWCIVVLHQYAALDFLLGWEMSRAIFPGGGD
jgi:uncharacterized membrane protein YsdA (DUF1294 family)